MAKIKEHQQRKQESEPVQKKGRRQNLRKDFNAQLHYLEKVITDRKKSRKRSTAQTAYNETKDSSRSLPHRHKEPPYGCLEEW